MRKSRFVKEKVGKCEKSLDFNKITCTFGSEDIFIL